MYYCHCVEGPSLKARIAWSRSKARTWDREEENARRQGAGKIRERHQQEEEITKQLVWK